MRFLSALFQRGPLTDEKLGLFRRIGENQCHSSVGGNPAVANPNATD